MSINIVGVDPGIVHTGLVRVSFNPRTKTIGRQCRVVDGLDMRAVEDWVQDTDDLIVVEKYNSRGRLSSNATMEAAERELIARVPEVKPLDNTGVVKVVVPGVLQTLGLWDFPQRTHHQDLRSAARIAVKGMMQDDKLNKLLADVVKARVDGTPWTIWVWEMP